MQTAQFIYRLAKPKCFFPLISFSFFSCFENFSFRFIAFKIFAVPLPFEKEIHDTEKKIECWSKIE